MKKHNLYLDNSSLKSIHYNLSHHSIQTIRKAVQLKQIQVLSNSILEKEISEHCELMIKTEIEKMNKDSALDTFFKTDLDNFRSKIKSYGAVKFMEYFNLNLSPKSIDCDVDWRIVFDKYFKKELPFSIKKKEEFPDAFVIEMLKKYTHKNLHLVSGDNDFIEWAKLQKNVSAYRSIKDFTDYFIKSQKSHLVVSYNKKSKTINKKIKEHIENTFNETDQFEADSYHSEITWANVIDIGNINKDIVSEDLEENSIEIEFNTNGKVELEISSSVVHYDSIDKEEMNIGSNRNSLLINVRFDGKLKLYFTNGGKIEYFEFYDEEVSPSLIEIPPDWESFLDDNDHE